MMPSSFVDVLLFLSLFFGLFLAFARVTVGQRTLDCHGDVRWYRPSGLVSLLLQSKECLA